MWRKGTEGNARQRPRPPRAPAPLSLRGALAGPSEDAPRHPAGHSSLTFLSATNPGPGAGQSRLFGPAALPTLRGAERITLGQKRVQPGPPGGPAPLLLGTTGLCTLAPGVSAGSRSCCVCRAGGADGSACLGQPSATAGGRGAQAAPSAQALRAPCTRRAAPHGLRLRSPPALSRPHCCLLAPPESLPWSGAAGGPHTPRQGTVQSSAEDAAQRGGQTHTWAPPRAARRGKRLSQPSRPRARPLGRRLRALPGALPGDRHRLGFRSWALRLQLCLCSKLLRGQAADQALTASTPHPRLGLRAEPPGLAPAFHYTLGGDVPSIAGQIQTREEPGAQ